MQISDVTAQAVAPQRAPEAKEAPGADHDHDGDNAAAVKSTPPQGVGKKVDMSA
ncbi:MAG: hypothetical protein P4L57_11305 [Rhizomicrobium sp.]|nr:hypothetical protein [Rhizomicrobium sp.]